VATIESRAQAIYKRRPVRILFLEAHDDRVRDAIEIIKKRKIAEPVLLHGNDVSKKLDDAKQMLQNGEADAVITGATHSTADTLRLAFNFVRKGVVRVSGAFIMISPGGKKMLFADCAAQPEPTPEQLAETALLTVETYKILIGDDPKVALLSYSTRSSGRGFSPMKIAEALKIIKKKSPKLKIEGEVQVDAALDMKVAKIKLSNPLIANIFIFPCLDSGNIGYKLVEYLGGWQAVGPVIQGLSKQVNDLSRGCKTDDIVKLAAVTAIQVNEQRKCR